MFVLNSRSPKTLFLSISNNSRSLCTIFLLACASLMTGSGCGESYPSEEMHLGDEDKTRPLAIVVDPPDASPGETVEVSILWHSETSERALPHWRVALEFDRGIYELEPVETRIVDVADLADIPAPVEDEFGFLRQAFLFTIPDSTLLWSPTIDALLDDDLLEELAGDLETDEVDKAAIDQFLSGLTAEDVAMMDPETQEFVHDLANLYSCSIRFRARLSGSATIDVTRNLTVRHASRLRSENVNTNPTIVEWAVLGVPYEDADFDLLDESGDEVVRYPFEIGGIAVETLGANGFAFDEVPVATVPRQSGWTYFLTVKAADEPYASPLSTVEGIREDREYFWYWLWTDNPTDSSVLFLGEEGDEVEMYDLDDRVRLAPPGGDGTVREMIHAVVRDERPEWGRFGVVQGATLLSGMIVFE